MQKLLRQKTTGSVYPWSKDLAKRNDMVEYVPEPKAAKEKAEPTEIQTMARAVLTKKPGRKPNAEEGTGEVQGAEAPLGDSEKEGSAQPA